MPELGNNLGVLSEGATTVESLLEERDLRDVVIVAHSKGGLIGKLVMVGEGRLPRVVRMVAICTPFAGSRYAQFMPIRALRDFSPTDPAGLSLRADESVNSRIVSVFGPFDPHIPEGSTLAGRDEPGGRQGRPFPRAVRPGGAGDRARGGRAR